MIRKSEPSKNKQAQPCFDLDALAPTQPPRTRIASAWEVINSSADKLDLVDALIVLWEIRRRASEACEEKFHKLSPQVRKAMRAMLMADDPHLPSEP